MAEQDARGALAVARREGRDEGLAEGNRDALLRLLDPRKLTPTEMDDARIASCSDVGLL